MSWPKKTINYRYFRLIGLPLLALSHDPGFVLYYLVEELFFCCRPVDGSSMAISMLHTAGCARVCQAMSFDKPR